MLWSVNDYRVFCMAVFLLTYELYFFAGSLPQFGGSAIDSSSILELSPFYQNSIIRGFRSLFKKSFLFYIFNRRRRLMTILDIRKNELFNSEIDRLCRMAIISPAKY